MEQNTDAIARLILSDGTEFRGLSLGSEGTVIGEVVFTTGMTGYLETLTDPSYYGQIVTQTFPLIGNYGVNEDDKESKKAWLSGYIVRECCEEPSNFRSRGKLSDWLKSQGVVAIKGIDTRSLTKKIRETGVMNGAITTEKNIDKAALLKDIRNFSIKDAVKTTSTTQIKNYADGPLESLKATLPSNASCNFNFKICLMDFGAKRNIARSLIRRGCELLVVPYNTTATEIEKLSPDGIMLSNGPGDPMENKDIIENLKEIGKLNIPIFGICLGHQLLALANGAKTEKLKYGHRGANQPVVDVLLDRTLVTTQNHGYAVVADSIKDDVGYISHYNANDGTCEGIAYKNIPAFTVQFHPEAWAGPLDTDYLFDRFFRLIKDNKNGERRV